MDANLMTVGPLLARAWAIDHEISYFILLVPIKLLFVCVCSPSIDTEMTFNLQGGHTYISDLTGYSFIFTSENIPHILL